MAPTDPFHDSRADRLAPNPDAVFADRVDRLVERLLELDPLASEVQERRLRRMLEVACRRLRSPTVVAESLWDPHNVSAILRSVEGLGLDEMHVVENPNRYRVSRGVTHGAERWLSIHRHPDLTRCLALLRGRGFLVCAADLGEDCVPIDRLPTERPVALVFGTEKDGLSRQARGHADLRFSIPMSGFTGSFNVSVSAAVALWELVGRRRESIAGSGELDDDEVVDRVRGWLARTTVSARRRGTGRRS